MVGGAPAGLLEPGAGGGPGLFLATLFAGGGEVDFIGLFEPGGGGAPGGGGELLFFGAPGAGGGGGPGLFLAAPPGAGGGPGGDTPFLPVVGDGGPGLFDPEGPGLPLATAEAGDVFTAAAVGGGLVLFFAAAFGEGARGGATPVGVGVRLPVAPFAPCAAVGGDGGGGI